jgi:glycerophosphoryl diester phosphodiesterase
MRYNILFILLILFSCKKNLKEYKGELIGHGAAGLKIQNQVFHDNSKEAVDFSLSMNGCDGVEIDIQLSKDGDLWLFHDTKLNIETNGEGCIYDLVENELAQIKYKTSNKERLTKLRALDFDKFQTKTLLLDIRHYTECQNKILDPALILSVLNSIEPLKNVKQNVFVLLSYDDWLKDFSNQGYKVFFSANSYDEYLSINTDLTEGVIVKNKGISKDQVQMLHDINKKVLIFDVRAPKETRLAMKKNPDAIVTDDLRTAIIEKR